MTGKCQVCGMKYIGEYIEYSDERRCEVWKCEKCNGLNMVKEPSKKNTLVIDDVEID